MEDWLSIEEILQKISAEGYTLTKRTFLYYVQLGLLPKGSRKGQKKGGVKFYYPSWTIDRLKEIFHLKKQGFKLKEIRERLSQKEKEKERPSLKERFPFWDQLLNCTACGICGAICPVYEEMDLPLWRLIQSLVQNGTRPPAANIPWICIGCHLCEERCPEEIPLMELLRFLRKETVQEKQKWIKHPEWSQLFWELVENRGRSFDFGAIHAYQVKITGAGENQRLILRLPSKGGKKEVSAPQALRDLEGFKRMLAKAKELS